MPGKMPPIARTSLIFFMKLFLLICPFLLNFPFLTSALIPASASSLEWNTTFGGPNYELASSLQFTGDGFILAGSTDSIGKGGRDAWLIKTDLNGKEEWNKTYGGVEDDFANFVFIDSTEVEEDNKTNRRSVSYLIVGSTESYGNMSKNATEENVWLIKTDSRGEELWNKTFLLPINVVRSIEVVSDGYIFTGEVSDKRYSDIKMFKTDFDGNIEWSKTFGGKLGEYAHAIVKARTGKEIEEEIEGEVHGEKEEVFRVKEVGKEDYIIVGHKWDYIKKESYAWILKTDSEGKEKWSKTFGGKKTDVASSVIRVREESESKEVCVNQNDNRTRYGYLVAGFTDSYGNGRKDAWIVYLDSNGNERWNRTFGGILDDAAYSIISIPDGFAFAGHTESTGNHAQAWLVKFDLPDFNYCEKNASEKNDRNNNNTDINRSEKNSNIIAIPGFDTLITVTAIIITFSISRIPMTKK